MKNAPAKLFLLLAGICGLIGIMLGGLLFEGAYELKLVHVHLLLFGWLSNAVYGLFYNSYPQIASGKIAWVHFGSALIGTLMLSVGFYFYGDEGYAWIIMIGANFVVLAAILFLVSLVRSFRLQKP